MPVGDPVLWIGVENGDARAMAREFRREDKRGGRLARAAFGVCKCNDWHCGSCLKSVRAPAWLSEKRKIHRAPVNQTFQIVVKKI
jgi:hypothetical protein